MVEQLENPNLKPNLANYETPKILYIVIYSSEFPIWDSILST